MTLGDDPTSLTWIEMGGSDEGREGESAVTDEARAAEPAGEGWWCFSA